MKFHAAEQRGINPISSCPAEAVREAGLKAAGKPDSESNLISGNGAQFYSHRYQSEKYFFS